MEFCQGICRLRKRNLVWRIAWLVDSVSGSEAGTPTSRPREISTSERSPATTRCVEHHLLNARKAGLSDDKIRQAIVLADTIRQVPAHRVLTLTIELLSVLAVAGDAMSTCGLLDPKPVDRTLDAMAATMTPSDVRLLARGWREEVLRLLLIPTPMAADADRIVNDQTRPAFDPMARELARSSLDSLRRDDRQPARQLSGRADPA